MKIGFHSWSAGLANNFRTSDPNHVWIRYLADRFEKDGIRMIWLGNTHSAYGMEQYVGPSPSKHVDGAIFYYRRSFPQIPKFKERNQAYEHQLFLMQELLEAGKMVAIFDGDFWISPEQAKHFSKQGIVLVSPTFYPQKRFQRLFYPPYLEGAVSKPSGNRRQSVVYVGNNYERYGMAKKYLAFKTPEPMVDIYGNWLEPSSGDREDPATVMEDFKFARFMGRSSQEDVLKILQEYALTIHLAKHDYARAGFIALRWYEAVAANTPALIPKEWRLPKRVLGRVNSMFDIQEIADLNEPYWSKIVLDSQRAFVDSVASYNHWKWLCELLADGSH